MQEVLSQKIIGKNASRGDACSWLSSHRIVRPWRVAQSVQFKSQRLSKSTSSHCESTDDVVSPGLVLPYGHHKYELSRMQPYVKIADGYEAIHLITPPESRPALEAALSQNPHLTSLPSPKPTLLSPADLDLTTGTAELMRLPEVQSAITGDFIVLPCDLVCELHGTQLLESWMITQGGLGGATGGENVYGNKMGLGGELSGRRGGLGVWYQTKDAASGGVGVKGEETDLLATTYLPAPAVQPHKGSLVPDIHNVVMTMPTAILKDIIEEDKVMKLRHALLRKHGRVRMLSTYRDAHIYFLPYWVKEFIKRNEAFESIGEDVLGWWAKAGWQEGLAAKLQVDKILQKRRRKSVTTVEEDTQDQPDVAALSTTSRRRPQNTSAVMNTNETSHPFASRVSVRSATKATHSPSTAPISIPPFLAFVQPSPTAVDSSVLPASVSQPAMPLIRRVDTTALLLSVSLRLARLASTEESHTSSTPPSPLAHIVKVADSSPVPQRATVTRSDCLIDANCTINEKTAIKECVIGVNCSIGAGARLTRCLLMEGAVIEEKAVLSGTVVGRRAKVGRECELKDCFVEEGFVVPAETMAKAEVFAGFDEDGMLAGSEDDEAALNEYNDNDDDSEEDQDA